MDKVRVGWIGVGARGTELLKMVLDHMPEIQVTGLCDTDESRIAKGCELINEKQGYTPFTSTDYRRIIERNDVDVIITPSAWDAHVDICVDAMNAGKRVATEVGGAYSIEQCWELVRTYERTGVPLMMLENCCYDKAELTVLNMIKQGLFGEIVHCAGGYRHDLRDEVALGNVNGHYRLRNYKNRNGELYPTHELGPIAKYLNINRGNRMVSLTSMASNARGVNYWINANKGADFENANFNFAQGDIVTTCIKCAHGETIVLTHDTTLPRPYSRGIHVQGTKGMFSEEMKGFLIATDHHWLDPLEKMYENYLHPLWKNYNAVGGHGGMDYLVMSAFIESVKNNTLPPIDVYDAAAWMSITTLSEDSIACGSMPMPIPDFTNGKWTQERPYERSRYCLEEVCEDLFE